MRMNCIDREIVRFGLDFTFNYPYYDNYVEQNYCFAWNEI